jgi:hypothetical protein
MLWVYSAISGRTCEVSVATGDRLALDAAVGNFRRWREHCANVGIAPGAA